MHIISLLRPHQWLKNTFIFLPLFFGKQFNNIENLIPTVIIFVAFCFAASSIYCFNDIYDVKADQLHPLKCKRPIASGVVSKLTGYYLMGGMLILSLSIILGGLREEKWEALTIILFYYLMNIAYCVKLKQIAIVDIFIIAFGFVLRILAGGLASGVWISHWIILMTFLLALFLALAKRRDDIMIYVATGTKARKNINQYSIEFMNQSIAIVASITVVCYIMYTVSEEVIERMNTEYLYTTSIFVLAGLLRYLQLTIVEMKSGSPTKILIVDRFIQTTIIGWIATFFFIIYM